MKKFEQQKIVEIVLYILDKTKGIDYYHIFKILYFADMKHLAKWGSRIVEDDFFALNYGPVPTNLYDAVKEINSPNSELAILLHKSISFAFDDAPNVLLARKKPNIDYISKSEIEALNESIEENSWKTFDELKNKSHDDAWSEAYNSSNKSISPVSMAKVMKADDTIIEYINYVMKK